MNRKSDTIRNEKVIRLLGKRVRDLRAVKGFSQADLAYYSGIAPTYISKIENGKFNTSLSHLAAIADAFDMPLHKLLEFPAK